MSDSRGKTILLVEDEILIAMAEKLALEGCGYAVVTVRSGEEAIALVDTTPGIDLILMDIDLGRGMDGSQAAETILRRRDLPVVFLSSHTEKAIVEKTERITSYGYVVKNSNITVLDTSIKMAFKLFEANQKFVERDEKYRLLADNVSDVLWMLELKSGRWLYVSPSVEKLRGYTVDEVMTQTLAQTMTPAAYAVVQEMMAAAFRKTTERTGPRTELITEVEQTRKDGSTVWTEALTRVTVDERGDPIVIGVSRDITERKLARDALRDSEARFRNILQGVESVAVQGYGPDGTTQYWNKASEMLYGYSEAEAIGRRLVDLIIPPEMRPDVERAIRLMAETGQPIPAAELSLMRKDGSKVQVLSSHTIVKISGKAQELFCIDVELGTRVREA